MTDTDFKIGHILIRVNDLSKAVKDFEEMGFTVIYGSNKKRARNAMIYFQDGSFLELFCVSKNKLVKKMLRFFIKIFKPFGFPIFSRYLMYLEDGEGLTDWALDCVPSNDYDSIVKYIETYMNLSKTKTMKRKEEDGVVVSWKMTVPKDSQYPFFMSSYFPEINHPKQHPNGIIGIKSVHLEVFPEFIAETNNAFNELFHTIMDTQNRHTINNNQYCFLNKGEYNKITLKKIILKGSINTENYLSDSLCHGANIKVESS